MKEKPRQKSYFLTGLRGDNKEYGDVTLAAGESKVMSTEIIDAQLLEKIGKLVRLFASDKDGEVLASVRALKRVLESNHLSFDSLAELFNHNIARLAYRDGREEGYQQGLRAQATQAYARHRYDDGTDDEEEVEGEVSLSAMAIFCFDRRDRLPRRQASFIANMFEYTRQGRKITEAQEGYLRGIYDRLRAKSGEQ